MLSSKLDDILKQQCDKDWDDVWFAIELIILIVGGVANTALLWLFLQERKSLSVSQVLGVNLVAMDLIYLSFIPVSLAYNTLQQANHSATIWQEFNSLHPVDVARGIFSMFNLIGCPLLLACMCIERYLAVVRPVLYLRMRKWEYRMAVSVAVWCVTFSSCLATGSMDSKTVIMMPVFLIVSCLFLIMLACLGGIVWSLQQQSPAHSTYGNQARSQSPLKRQAVVNVLAVVVPAVISYLPVLVMTPMTLCILYGNFSFHQGYCEIAELSAIFPKFGVLIGPLFYFSKARQIFCLSGPGKKCNK